MRKSPRQVHLQPRPGMAPIDSLLVPRFLRHRLPRAGPALPVRGNGLFPHAPTRLLQLPPGTGLHHGQRLRPCTKRVRNQRAATRPGLQIPASRSRPDSSGRRPAISTSRRLLQHQRSRTRSGHGSGQDHAERSRLPAACSTDLARMPGCDPARAAMPTATCSRVLPADQHRRAARRRLRPGRALPTGIRRSAPGASP